MKQKILRFFSDARVRMVLLFLISTVYVQAQSGRIVTGVVKDATGETVIGVNVTVKGNATLGTITDLDGKYSLSVPAQKATLVFSFIGYQTQEKTIDANTKTLNVTLAEDSKLLEEVVVVGYGTMKRKDVTGAVAHIGEEVTKNRAATNALDFLVGAVPGVHITPSTEAGGGASGLLIRGKQSLKASTSPLIVLDGVVFYGNIGDINPNDIESMDILKDASSTAIYGSKGSAGVILINTKKGTSEKPIINVSTKIGVSQATFMPEMPTAQQYMQRRMDYYKTIDYFTPGDKQKGQGYYDNPDNLPEGVSRDEWAAYDPSFSGDYTETWMQRLNFNPIEIQNYKAGKFVDWMDLVYQTGVRQDYNASVSGKTESICAICFVSIPVRTYAHKRSSFSDKLG